MKGKLNFRSVKAVALLAITFTLYTGISSLNYSQAGSTSDPLVTLSYIEMKLEALKEELREEFSSSQSSQTVEETDKTEGESLSSEDSSNALFKVIELKAGDKVYLGESTEYILRAGEALIIEGPGGGIADLTTGVDLKNNEIVPLNHHSLSARDDGRGLSATTDGWILIKGKYKIVSDK